MFVGGPNPRRGSKSASGFGPGGPNPRGVQIRCDTGSPVFSINFINRLIPAKLKYLMSIENSQAILKYFIDLKSETSVNQTRLEIYKAFQDRLTILNRLIAEIY